MRRRGVSLAQQGIRGVLHNCEVAVFAMVTKNVGIAESNQEKVKAILAALRICAPHVHKLVVKSDSSNAISWVSSFAICPLEISILLQ